MHVEAVELRVIALPMVAPFVAAHGTVSSRTAVLVRILGTEDEGWGECAALPEPTYSEEFVDGAYLALQELLVPRLLATNGTVTATDLSSVFAEVIGHPMAKASIELALLDAQGRRSEISLARMFAPHSADPAATVPAGVAIGLLATPEDLAAEVSTRVAEGYGRIKIKIAPGRDIDFIQAARDAVGVHIELSVDANGAYTLDDAKMLAGLDDFDLAYIEQPLAADNLLNHAELARRISTRICLDESLTSATVTREALDMGACSVVCVKAPRYGSWVEAASVLDHCAGLGIDAWVGGMLDGGIGRAANIALAAHLGASLTGDIAATNRFFTEDVCAPFTVAGPSGGGTITVPSGPGLGISIDAAALSKLTLRSTIIRR
ncbi:MAG: o-succinylbenzoate synthase [Acidimicrobiia bacterium]|nr:o-succinylbenzoate synthase [Acidimicrobiia bacterium]